MAVGGGGVPHGSSVELGIEGITEATRIGQGGFGTVYRARQAVFGRTVAVKVLSTPVLDDETSRRFEQECRAVGALSGHPHVVAVYASGHTTAGQPYLVQDYLPGGTLAQRVAELGPRPWEEVADIGAKLAGALAAAHAAGVLHRDIKPENVLLSTYGEPQLTDFGVARIQGGTHTQSGVITGSLAHAAPEVLSGRPATEASDVYSLASTLYTLAAGHAPFVRPGDETFHPLLNRIMSEAPPDLRAQGLPGPLWDVLAAALAKDPSVRTSSARAFGEGLRAAQRAGGLAPTHIAAPESVETPFVAGAVAPGLHTATSRWARPRPAAPVATSPSAPRDDRTRRVPPVWLAGAAVALVALIAAAVALSAGDGDDAAGPATPITAPAPAAAEPAPATTVTTGPAPQASTTAPSRVPTTVRTPAPTLAPLPPAGTAPAGTASGSTPACTPSMFRPTITRNRPTYRNGETVQVSARFENISGRPCSYPATTATSQVLTPSGEPLGPARTLTNENAARVPFEPGTSQTFQSFWDVAICSSGSTCFPGRYTIAVDVAPFGGGRVSFDVT